MAIASGTDASRDLADADGSSVPGYLAIAWHGASDKRPGPQRSLDLRAIAAAGISLADEGGLEGVSMRSVGARLGITSMGLYRYVHSKDELLALMIDEALGPPNFPAAKGDWRDQLTAWSYAARARFEAHPWVLNVSLPDPPALPNQIQWTERGLEGMRSTQLSATEKLSVLLLINVYVRGQTQLASALQGAEPEKNAGGRYARLLLRLADPERFPHLVTAMTEQAASPPADFAYDAFTFGLNTVLDGIAHRV
jgi:AcrR family transcriptional regulator